MESNYLFFLLLLLLFGEISIQVIFWLLGLLCDDILCTLRVIVRKGLFTEQSREDRTTPLETYHCGVTYVTTLLFHIFIHATWSLSTFFFLRGQIKNPSLEKKHTNSIIIQQVAFLLCCCPTSSCSSDSKTLK